MNGARVTLREAVSASLEHKVLEKISPGLSYSELH